MITFTDVGKEYGSKTALKSVNMVIEQGRFVVLIGPSGCGKTTSLKLINGLIMPSCGEVLVEGRSTADWNPIELKRKIGYVIQQVGLFPYMKIWENIAYVLKIMGVSRQQQRKRARDLIDLVEMDVSYLDQYPRQLSGGQQQRIGVARALAAEPDIILMDEPFGAIDQITRRILQDEILKLQQKLKKTVVFVTHDIQEAMILGSQIALFREGGIEQMGSARDLIMHPASDFVKEFFGNHDFMSLMEHVYVEAVMNQPPEAPDSWPYPEGPVTNDQSVFMGIQNRDGSVHPAPFVKMNTSVREALKMMLLESREWLAVVDDTQRLQGIIALKEIYRGLRKDSSPADVVDAAAN
ncbi:MAG: ABC transporter ATP-binding protein [Bacillota bacterium]|nr:ABC transporter ATP-binding protein [Bacillota bacterium]MDW7677877.1 ABC transporter ATP-binding protein [Bacillota bacterium]